MEDATPCYASHHMMLVLLYGLAHNTYLTLKPRLVFSTLKPRVEHTHTRGRIFLRTDFFFGMYPWWELETRFARIISVQWLRSSKCLHKLTLRENVNEQPGGLGVQGTAGKTQMVEWSSNDTMVAWFPPVQWLRAPHSQICLTRKRYSSTPIVARIMSVSQREVHY